MKQIITIIALMMVFATSAKAQIIGATSESQSPRQNTYSNADLYKKGQRNIKTGNIIFLSGVGAGVAIGLIPTISEGKALALLVFPFIGAAAGGAVAAPFWITGSNMKRQAGSVAHTPLIRQDFHLDDDLTLTTSVGITNYAQIVPNENGLQSNALSVGFSLSF